MHLSVKKIGISLLSVCLLSLFACTNIETSSAQALTAKEGHLDVTQLSDSGIGIKPEESRVKDAIAKGYALIQC